MTKEEAIKVLRSVSKYTEPKEAFTMAIEALSRPSISNLDEAVERMASDIAPDYPDISWDTCYEKIEEGIKAGAEWMAGQGVTVEGVFVAGDPGFPDVRMGEQYSIEHILRKPGGIEPGDKVIVQIRKK